MPWPIFFDHTYWMDKGKGPYADKKCEVVAISIQFNCICNKFIFFLVIFSLKDCLVFNVIAEIDAS